MAQRAADEGSREAIRVVAETDICIASGNCAMRLPSVFGQREDDGVVEIRERSPGTSLRDAVVQAVENCPSGALSIEVKEGQEDADS